MKITLNAGERELINDDTVVNLGMGPTYVLPQSKLRAFKD